MRGTPMRRDCASSPESPTTPPGRPLHLLRRGRSARSALIFTPVVLVYRAERPAQDGDGSGSHADGATGRRRVRGGSGGGIERVDFAVPGLARSGRWDGELQRFPPAVDQDEEVVVEERAAVGGPVGVVGA